MKLHSKNIIISVILVILLVCFCFMFREKSKIVKNQKINVALTSKPRLEDDFYENINYEILSQIKIDDSIIDDSWSYFKEAEDKINDEVDLMIDEILMKCDTYSSNSIEKKICDIVDLYEMKNINYQKEREIVQKYVDLIKSSNTIDDLQKNVSIVNKEMYQVGIFFKVDYDEVVEEKKLYNTIELNRENYLNVSKDNETIYGMQLNYNISLLKKYGYENSEAIKIVNDVDNLFSNITKYQDNSEKTDNNILTIDELNNKYPNINFDYFKELLFIDNDNIIVINEPQINQLNKYMTNDNLELLKNYALLRLLNEYGNLTDNELEKEFYELAYYVGGEIKESDKKKLMYNYIKSKYFNNYLVNNFYKKHFINEKDYYYKLCIDYLDVYKSRIENTKWLSKETKEKAILKLNSMSINVAYYNLNSLIENEYNFSGNSYVEKTNNFLRSYDETCKKMFENNDMVLISDLFEVNAYYSPNTNSISINLGFIYMLKEFYNIDINNEDDYYRVLGLIGSVIGHEIGHSFDTEGSKYDENGKKINWWDDEDKIEYNRLTYNIETLYDKYNQSGYNTLGENIADLSGMAVTLDLASKKGASKADYKKIFESYAKIHLIQNNIYQADSMLVDDVHSPDKNRVNVVLSNMDKFYEVYDIKESDKMYIPKEERVHIW